MSTSRSSNYPVLPLKDVVVFPHMVIPLFVGRDKSVAALETVMQGDKQILLVTQKDAQEDSPSPEDLYGLGTIATVLQLLKLPDGTVKVLVEGQSRATLMDVSDNGTYFEANAAPVQERDMVGEDVEALMRTVVSQF
jgi:ATP-dependent Lon protease